jgi:hypothetical protein
MMGKSYLSKDLSFVQRRDCFKGSHHLTHPDTSWAFRPNYVILWTGLLYPQKKTDRNASDI